VLDAALHGVDPAWMSECPVAEDLAAGRLLTVLDNCAELSPELCPYYPRHRHVAAGLRAFIDVIRECAPTHAGSVPGLKDRL